MTLTRRLFGFVASPQRKNDGPAAQGREDVQGGHASAEANVRDVAYAEEPAENDEIEREDMLSESKFLAQGNDDRENRRYTMFSSAPCAFPERLSDINMLENDEDIIEVDKDIIDKAVALGHITRTAADRYKSKEVVAADREVFVSQLQVWQDKTAKETATKKLAERPADSAKYEPGQPLFKYFREHAKINPWYGFLLQVIPNVCSSEAETLHARLLQEACTPRWYEGLCAKLFHDLELHMPHEAHEFDQATCHYNAASARLKFAVDAIVTKYTTAFAYEGAQRKEQLMAKLSRAMDYCGLDKRLKELADASVELLDYNERLSNADRCSVLMASLSKVPLTDTDRAPYKYLCFSLDRGFTYPELIQRIREVQNTSMRSPVKNRLGEHILLCTHCNVKGH